jgi:hypothetical protein
MTCIWPWRGQPMKMFCMTWPVYDLDVKPMKMFCMTWPVYDLDVKPMKMFCMTWPVYDLDVVNQWKCFVWHDLYLTLTWLTNENVLYDMTCIWPWRGQLMNMFYFVVYNTIIRLPGHSHRHTYSSYTYSCFIW